MQHRIHELIDKVASFFGSVKFLLLNTVVFIVWLSINTLAPQWLRFDAFPFNFLTLSVSLEAIYLSIFVLISQNRQAERNKAHMEEQRAVQQRELQQRELQKNTELNRLEETENRNILAILHKQNETLADMQQVLKASKRTLPRSL